jgi:hypothetical protein
MPRAQSKFVALRARMRRNLRRLYSRCTPEDKREGLAWYPTAVAGCLTWSRGFNVDARTIACTIAAISPQCDWTSNLRIAFELLSGQSVVSGGAIRANVEKARRILADRAVSLAPYFKNGPKINAFAANLSGDASRVTVDVHAVQAALNDPLFNKPVNPAGYPVVAGVYREVAESFGVRPCDFQATIWCHWKRVHPTSRKKQLLAARKRAERTV